MNLSKTGGKWKPLFWKQRQWLQLNQEVVQDFSLEEWHYSVYPQAFAALYFPILKSDQYCRYNRIIDVLSKISCSCAASQTDLMIVSPSELNTPCSLDPKILVGAATLCAGFDYQLEVQMIAFLLKNEQFN